MQTLANRFCDTCSAAHYGSVEDFNKWIAAHKTAEHTTAADLLAEHIEEEIAFLSTHPKKDAIEERISELSDKLREQKKIDPSDPKGRGDVQGSQSGFALS